MSVVGQEILHKSVIPKIHCPVFFPFMSNPEGVNAKDKNACGCF